MRYFIVLVLLLTACAKEAPNPLFSEEGVRFWGAYSRRMQGRCLRRWDGANAIVSTDNYNKNPAWVAICFLNHECDFENSNKCVTAKRCSSFAHGSRLYEYIQGNHFKEVKCGGTNE